MNGGWEFVAPDGGSYELNYIADSNGYQPQAKHIPVHVDDTEDVKNAKVQFYKIFDKTSAKMDALNTKRVERDADEPVGEAEPETVVPIEEASTENKPIHYTPFYGFFLRHMAPKSKLTEDEVQKVHINMKDIHEKYMTARKEKLEKLAKYSPYPYSPFYYYPQHLVPDMKVSKEELEKIQMDLKQIDEQYMKEMKEQSDVLAAEFPYYPNFYPKITHFPVKESNDVDGKEDTEEEKMLPRFGPFHPYGMPYYNAYSHHMMQEENKAKEDQSVEKKTHIFPKPYLTYSPYFYGYRYPYYKKEEMVNTMVEDAKKESTEHSRKKRDAQTINYATYPYYPMNALYYPGLTASQVYHPSLAKVTRTVVNLPDAVVDNALDSGDDVDVVDSQDTVVASDIEASGLDEEPEVEAEAEAEVEAEEEAETPAEPEVMPENHLESSEVVSDNGVKVAQAVKQPLYYPSQGLLYPSVANTNPVFNPFWATRLNYYPVYPTYGYATGIKQAMKTKTKGNVIQDKYSTFPVKQKDLKLAAIVA